MEPEQLHGVYSVAVLCNQTVHYIYGGLLLSGGSENQRKKKEQKLIFPRGERFKQDQLARNRDGYVFFFRIYE